MDGNTIDFEKIDTLEDAIAIIKFLVNENLRLSKRVEELERENLALKEKVASLEKNSSNSSKPPSSDIVKPPKEGSGKGKRRIGGQPGHKGYYRELLPPEQIDDTVPLFAKQCSCCGCTDLELQPELDKRYHQVADLVEKPIQVIEYHQYASLCKNCSEINYGELPDGVIANQFVGPGLTSLLGYMKGGMSVSISELQQFCRDVLKISLSQGTIINAIFRVSEALKKPYEEIGQKISEQKVLNIDETSWTDSGKTLWVWLFCSQMVAYFTIQTSRGSKVLKDVLGETFRGAIISDFYSAYVSYANAMQQFCLAHLIRDIKFLTTLPCPKTAQFGDTVLRQFKSIFKLWHQRDSYAPDYFVRRVERIQRRLFTLLLSADIPPGKALTMKKRLMKHWDSLFRFLVHPTLLQPTNNLAEQTLRPLVKMRRLSQGSRSNRGQLWAARSMSVFQTCKKQHLNTWDFLQQALRAHCLGLPAPSLILCD